MGCFMKWKIIENKQIQQGVEKTTLFWMYVIVGQPATLTDMMFAFSTQHIECLSPWIGHRDINLHMKWGGSKDELCIAEMKA